MICSACGTTSRRRRHPGTSSASTPNRPPRSSSRRSSSITAKDPPRTHDLVGLLAACAAFEPELGALTADCGPLVDYAVAARYPTALADPDAEEGREAVAAALRVRAALLARLPAPPP